MLFPLPILARELELGANELELGASELELGTDELDGTTELLLGAMLDELGIAEEELSADSMSDVQENKRPLARTGTQIKTLFTKYLLPLTQLPAHFSQLFCFSQF